MVDSLVAGFFSAVCGVPFRIVVFPKSSIGRVSLQLSRAGFPFVDGGQYLSGSAAISAALSLFPSVFSLWFFSPLESLAVLLLSLGLLLAFFFLMPYFLAKRRMALAESELPFLLRESAVYLDIGVPFEKMVARIAARNYALSLEFRRASQEIKSGATVQSAMAGMARGAGSLPIKRCLMLLSSLYETGGGNEPLRRTAEELSSSQLSSMRMQSGRISFLSILFICCSALIPSFFTVFISVSPAISAPVPDWQVYLAFLFLFPLLNLFALLLVFLLLPPSSAQSCGADLLERFLKKSGFSYGSRAFALALAAFFSGLAAIAFLYGSLLLCALFLCAAPASYAAASYFASREIEEAESHLPDALYAAASTHRLLSAEKMLSFLSKGGFGLLSEAFEIALRRQKAGESFASSMAAAAFHCPSPLVERALSLLVVSYDTGANMYFALREAAQDVVSFFTLVRERSSQLAIQRYTMLAACSFLVPLILGTVVSLSPALSNGNALFGQGGGNPLPLLSIACPLYLAINCLLSSVLLALFETNPKRAALYFAFCAPISQIVFSLSSASNSGGLPLPL